MNLVLKENHISPSRNVQVQWSLVHRQFRVAGTYFTTGFLCVLPIITYSVQLASMPKTKAYFVWTRSGLLLLCLVVFQIGDMHWQIFVSMKLATYKLKLAAIKCVGIDTQLSSQLHNQQAHHRTKRVWLISEAICVTNMVTWVHLTNNNYQIHQSNVAISYANLPVASASMWFSILADEATDVSHNEQMSISDGSILIMMCMKTHFA